MSMLHLALHLHGLDLQVKNNKDPESDDFYALQVDPTMLLLQLKHKADIMMLQKGLARVNSSSIRPRRW